MDTHNFRLLVADDDPGFRETVEGILAPHFETITVESGEEAVEVVEHREVHLVLLDMHMHILTGVEAVQMLKALQAELPCILITSDVTAQLEREAALARAYTVLRKPPTRRRLLQTIESALGEAYGWRPETGMSLGA